MVTGIPEYSIKDMVNWFRFVAGNQPRLLSGLEVSLIHGFYYFIFKIIKYIS